jgi:hypothetical protein
MLEALLVKPFQHSIPHKGSTGTDLSGISIDLVSGSSAGMLIDLRKLTCTSLATNL